MYRFLSSRDCTRTWSTPRPNEDYRFENAPNYVQIQSHRTITWYLLKRLQLQICIFRGLILFPRLSFPRREERPHLVHHDLGQGLVDWLALLRAAEPAKHDDADEREREDDGERDPVHGGRVLGLGEGDGEVGADEGDRDEEQRDLGQQDGDAGEALDVRRLLDGDEVEVEVHQRLLLLQARVDLAQRVQGDAVPQPLEAAERGRREPHAVRGRRRRLQALGEGGAAASPAAVGLAPAAGKRQGRRALDDPLDDEAVAFVEALEDAELAPVVVQLVDVVDLGRLEHLIPLRGTSVGSVGVALERLTTRSSWGPYWFSLRAMTP